MKESYDKRYNQSYINKGSFTLKDHFIRDYFGWLKKYKFFRRNDDKKANEYVLGTLISSEIAFIETLVSKINSVNVFVNDYNINPILGRFIFSIQENKNVRGREGRGRFELLFYFHNLKLEEKNIILRKSLDSAYLSSDLFNDKSRLGLLKAFGLELIKIMLFMVDCPPNYFTIQHYINLNKLEKKV